MTPNALEELKKPLDPKNVSKRTQSGRQLDYIEGWFAIAEANRIFGHDAWASETVDIKCVSEKPRKIGQSGKDGWGVSYVARVRITADGVVREGVGAGHGIDADLGLAHESAIKEAETDARKRGLMTFGWPFGLALYDKSRENVASEPAGNPASRGAGGGSSPAAPASANREDPADTYVKTAIAAMNTARSAEDLKAWWADQANAREDFGITKGGKRYALLWDALLAKGTALKSQPDPDAWQSEEEAA